MNDITLIISFKISYRQKTELISKFYKSGQNWPTLKAHNYCSKHDWDIKFLHGIEDDNEILQKKFQDLGPLDKKVAKDGNLLILTKYNFFTTLPKVLKIYYM